MNANRNKHNAQPFRCEPGKVLRLSVLALALTNILYLSACSSGGGTVQAPTIVPSPPPPPLPPPPPPPLVTGPCLPTPLTRDCIVDLGGTVFYDTMYGGRQSDFALIKRGTGELHISDDNRFSGGTTIENGVLHISIGNNLQSNTTVQSLGQLRFYGNLRGNLTNDGVLSLMQYEFGCDWGWGGCDEDPRARIEGDYRQSATAKMKTTLGWILLITGKAQLDGALLLDGLRADSTGQYVFPTVPTSQKILHADGGVFGTFSSWSAVPGLFIDGSLRYAPNDVYFDLTRISLVTTMSRAAVGTASTIDSAAHLDLAFKYADQFGQLPGVEQTPVQQAFLASAASIQHIQDFDQAVASLDSLSGQAYASANQVLLEQIGLPSQQLSARLDRLQSGAKAGSWVGQPAAGGALSGNGNFTLNGQITGYDQWLTDRLLVGSSFGENNARMQFEQEGAQLTGHSPQWNAYLHYAGDRGWYASGGFGFEHSQLYAQRALNLGDAGVHQASSERSVDLSHIYAETGRKFNMGQGQLTPFAAMSFVSLRSEGFTEQGGTGFELMVQPGHERQLTGDAGLRYTQDWQLGNKNWLQFNFSGRYRQQLASDGQALRASFTGAPLAVFELNGSSPAQQYGLLGVGLTGGFGEGLSWFVDFDKRLDANQYGDIWSAGMQFDF